MKRPVRRLPAGLSIRPDRRVFQKNWANPSFWSIDLTRRWKHRRSLTRNSIQEELIMNKSTVTGLILAALFALAPATATADPAGDVEKMEQNLVQAVVEPDIATLN